MRIDEAKFIIVDVESTGLDPAKDRVIEIAAVATYVGNESHLGFWQSYVDPGIPIPAEISGLTGITDAHVSSAPCFEAARARCVLFAESMFGWNYKGLPYILAAHNWDFDGAFLHPNHELISRAVCTKRLAQHLWPELTSHRNQSLRYSRNLNVDTFGIGAHRALGDALVTAALLRNELQSAEFLALGIKDVDALIDYAESPIILSTFPFGKHKGKLISEVPDDYIAWCLRDMKDLSRDMRATLEQRLGARA